MFVIDEAQNGVAFLTGEDGFDIALIHRIQPADIDEAEFKSACLSDVGWQKLVNLIAAAPEMLTMLKRISAGEQVQKEEVDIVIAVAEQDVIKCEAVDVTSEG